MANPGLSEEERKKLFDQLKEKFDGKASFVPTHKTIGKSDKNHYRTRSKNKQK